MTVTDSPGGLGLGVGQEEACWRVKKPLEFSVFPWDYGDVMVNFMFSLTGLRDAQIDAKTVFLGVSVRLSPEEVGAGISRQE